MILKMNAKNANAMSSSEACESSKWFANNQPFLHFSSSQQLLIG
jgi:hypothetical protein